MRQIAWRSAVPYREYLLHDEVRVGVDGRVHSVQWLALPSATDADALARRLDARSLSLCYFATIQRRLHALVRARRAGADVRLSVLGIPLLRLAGETVLQDQHTVAVDYAIDGGLLDATPTDKGRFCIKLFERGASEWRLAVEITRYRPLPVALVRSSVLYRVTESTVHRWVSFHFLRWCVDHADLLTGTTVHV